MSKKPNEGFLDLLDFWLWQYSCTYLYDLCVFKGAVIDSKAEKRKEPDHHRYFDMEKHGQQSRIQNKSKRNHRIH